MVGQDLRDLKEDVVEQDATDQLVLLHGQELQWFVVLLQATDAFDHDKRRDELTTHGHEELQGLDVGLFHVVQLLDNHGPGVLKRKR